MAGVKLDLEADRFDSFARQLREMPQPPVSKVIAAPPRPRAPQIRLGGF
jgi:hypothetical protein